MEIKKSYSLATFDSPKIVGVRDLSKSEFEKFLDSINALTKINLDEKLFRIVDLNYSDLKRSIQRYIDNYDKEPRADISQFEYIFLDVNRLILNLLSSIRTFLDHTETRFKREFGNSSDEVKLFKMETGTAYDKYFSYRFLYKLRNYSQHCGLPTGRVKILSTAADENIQGSESVNVLTLQLVRENLIKTFDAWSNLVKTEIELQPQEFDIIPLIDEHVSTLKDLNKKLNQGIYNKYQSEAQELLNLIQETKSIGGIPCLIEATGTDLNIELGINYFPFEAISKITGIEINMTYRKND